MTIASRNARRASELIAFLESQVSRPRVVPPKPAGPPPLSNGTCRDCMSHVVYATTPRGFRMPLERHPEGDLVVADGIVRERGPLYGELARYVRHVGKSCRDAQRRRA